MRAGRSVAQPSTGIQVNIVILDLPSKVNVNSSFILTLLRQSDQSISRKIVCSGLCSHKCSMDLLKAHRSTYFLIRLMSNKAGFSTKSIEARHSAAERCALRLAHYYYGRGLKEYHLRPSSIVTKRPVYRHPVSQVPGSCGAPNPILDMLVLIERLWRFYTIRAVNLQAVTRAEMTFFQAPTVVHIEVACLGLVDTQELKQSLIII
jgi:hypothetical protein